MASRSKQIELVAALLDAESTMALATTDDCGLAAATPLFYIVDEELCLYWVSSGSTEHSRNLKQRPTAAATVYRSTDEWKAIRGVQMRGSVSPVTNDHRRQVLLGLYSDRFRRGTILRQTIARSTLYTLRPHFVRYIDNSNYFGYKFELVFTAVEETL